MTEIRRIRAQQLLTLRQVASIVGAKPRDVCRDITRREPLLGALRIGKREYRVFPSEARRYLVQSWGATSEQLRRLDHMIVTSSPPAVMDTCHLADILQVSQQHIRNAIRAGELGAVAFGTKIRIHTDNAWSYLMTLDRVGRLHGKLIARHSGLQLLRRVYK